MGFFLDIVPILNHSPTQIWINLFFNPSLSFPQFDKLYCMFMYLMYIIFHILNSNELFIFPHSILYFFTPQDLIQWLSIYREAETMDFQVIMFTERYVDQNPSSPLTRPQLTSSLKHWQVYLLCISIQMMQIFSLESCQRLSCMDHWLVQVFLVFCQCSFINSDSVTGHMVQDV